MQTSLWVALAALVSVGFAGCVSDPQAPPAETEPIAAPEGVGFIPGGAPVGLGSLPVALGELRYTGFGSFEPTIGITSDGTMFVASFPIIIRSMDKGVTWDRVSPSIPPGINNPPQSNDPYVWVDPDTDRVFSNDLQLLLCSWLNYSDDLGETWVSNPAGCGMPPGVHDHQSIGTARPRNVETVGYDNLVIYCVNRVADSVCSTSLNGGLTFGPLVPTYPGLEPGRGTGALCGGLHGHVKSDPDGRIFLPKGQCGIAEVARSEDDGITWTRHTINQNIPVSGHEVAIASDDVGNLYALWMGQADGLPYMAVSTDHAETWGPAHMVAPPGVTAADFPAIAAGAEGRIAFAYVGTTIEDGYNASDMSKADWNAYIGVITNALDAQPVIQTVTANDPEEPISQGVCGRTRCNADGDFIDITIDPEGRPWAPLGDCFDRCSGPGEGELGFVGTLTTGPALRGELVALAPLPPVPVTVSES